VIFLSNLVILKELRVAIQITDITQQWRQTWTGAAIPGERRSIGRNFH